MKKTLLFICTGLYMCLAASAHTTDPNTIVYDDAEFFDIDTNPQGWDPTGTLPPQPEADYYINMPNAVNVYYRFERVEGSTPLYYECPVSEIQGDFKIYAKEYWTERNTPGYDGNKYIYGSLHQPTGFDRDTYKELGQPGGDLQIEGGGSWYGCMVQFYPDGDSNHNTPGIFVTGGSHNLQAIFLSATGVSDSPTTGHIDFSITTGGVVRPTEQTYTVTMTYADTNGPKSRSMEVTGLSGTFENITDLEAGGITDFVLTADIRHAPVFSDPAHQEEIVGYKDLSAEEKTYISTPQQFFVYLIGNIKNREWDPNKGIRGTLLASYVTYFADDSEIYAWADVPFTGDMRFRFADRVASNWSTLEANGIQYAPSSQTQLCGNLLLDNSNVDEGNWYDYQTIERSATGNAWAPDSPRAQGSASDGLHYNVFFNRKTQKVGVSWSTEVGISGIPDEVAEIPVDVYDLTGRCVLRGVLPSQAGGTLSPGIYIAGNKKIAVR